MLRLIADSKLSCLMAKQISLLHPFTESPNLSSEDYRLLSVQGFVWYTDGIIFNCDNGFVWLTAYEASETNLQKDTETAIVVPVEVPEEKFIRVANDLYKSDIRLSMPSGHYRMLFELREMKDEEFYTKKYVEAYPHIAEPDLATRPEVCTLTFVPVEQKVKPQLLKFKPSIPYQYRRQVMRGEMSANDFLPDKFVMYDTPVKTGW